MCYKVDNQLIVFLNIFMKREIKFRAFSKQLTQVNWIAKLFKGVHQVNDTRTFNEINERPLILVHVGVGIGSGRCRFSDSI